MDINTTPTYELNSFAWWVAKATEAYFKNPDVKRRFEEWQKERRENDGQALERVRKHNKHVSEGQGGIL